MTIKKLTAMPYAQAHIEIDETGNIYLYSYVTLVASIENGWLKINGLHSMTTRKHISAFCREYADCEYSTAKTIYNDGYQMNIHTGEIIPVCDTPEY